MKNILFFGDSLTAGYGLQNPSLESFPSLVEKELREACFGYKVINAGISGETTKGGLDRIDLLLHQPIDVFVLELGANDLLRGINPNHTLKNLQAIIDKVKFKNPSVRLVLLGMELPLFIPGNVAAEFRGVFRKVAENNEMDFLPFLLDGVVGIQKLNLKDGLHPSAEGYKIIAKNVWKLLKTFL